MNFQDFFNAMAAGKSSRKVAEQSKAFQKQTTLLNNQLYQQNTILSQMGMAYNQPNNESKEVIRVFNARLNDQTLEDQKVDIRTLTKEEAVELAEWLRTNMKKPYYVDTNVQLIMSTKPHISVRCQDIGDALLLKLTWGGN